MKQAVETPETEAAMSQVELADHDVSITQIAGIVAVLRSELIVYIKDKFGVKHVYQTTLKQDNLSLIVSELISELDAKKAIETANAQSYLGSTINFGKKIVSTISSDPISESRLRQLSYLTKKADLLEQQLNEIQVLLSLDTLSFNEDKQKEFSTLGEQLKLELDEFSAKLSEMVSKRYTENVEAIVGESKHLLFGMMSNGDKSALAANLKVKILSQFNLEKLSKAVHSYCQMTLDLKRNQHTRLIKCLGIAVRKRLSEESEQYEQQLAKANQDKFVLFGALRRLGATNHQLQSGHSHCLDVLDQNGLSMLHKAIIRGDLEDVNRLLEAKANPNVVTRKHGYSPLCLSIIHVQLLKLRKDMKLDIVKALLQKGVNVNEPISLYDHSDESTLKPIMQCNILHVILFENFAKNPSERTLRKDINLELVRLLLESGVDLTACPVGDPHDTARNIPNLLADESEQSEVITLLRQYQKKGLACN